MSEELINIERKAAIFCIELHRPQRVNALSRDLLLALCAAVDEAQRDASVRAIVIHGAGKGFSSGFDLKDQMALAPVGAAIWREILDLDFKATMQFWDCKKPTIAAVHGPCLAGAFELALACDYTIASSDAFFGEPELKFGAGIVTMLLPWITGPKQAKRIILSGLDHIPAQEALSMGIVSEVVQPGEHLTRALQIASHLSAMDPVLVQETKKAINQSYEIQGMQAALQRALDIDHGIESHGSPDKQQFMSIARQKGLAAAIAWRDARFS